MISVNYSVGFLHIKSTENEIEQQSVNPLCESLMINKALVKLNLSSKAYKKGTCKRLHGKFTLSNYNQQKIDWDPH